MLGGRSIVMAAEYIASAFGVPDLVIGLTLVAIGTSLPELATSAVAAYKGNADIAIGNVVGSNIFNLLGIVGVAALVGPLTVPDRIAGLDLWVLWGRRGVGRGPYADGPWQRRRDAREAARDASRPASQAAQRARSARP